MTAKAASELRRAALAHAIECYRGPDDDTLPVLREWLAAMSERPDSFRYDAAAVLDRLRDWIDPTMDTYQPYAVDIGDDVILAVGVDDLRVLLDGTR